MKSILLLVLSALLCHAAPSVVATGKGATNTKPFTMAGPYQLSWDSTFANKDLEWITVMVMDATTGKQVAAAASQPKSATLHVPEGGRHFLQIMSSADSWTFKAEATGAANPKPGSRPNKIRVETKEEILRRLEEEAVRAATLPAPKPSSVKGWPAGLEPARKGAALPTGVTKGK